MTEQSTDGTDRGVRLGHKQDPTDNEYATPPEIWRPLARAVNGFDTDPASGAEPEPIAPTRYTAEDDGLRKAWGGWVWLNPPWSSNGDGSAKKKWARKARNEAARDTVDGVVMLLPCDTSSHVFHDHVAAADVFCLVGPGRIPFHGGDRNPSFELVLAIYADDVPGDLVDALDQLGIVVEGRTVVDEHPQAALVTDGGQSTDGTERWEETGYDWICTGCAKIVTSQPFGPCHDCGHHFRPATADDAACDRCDDSDGRRLLDRTGEYDRLCPACIDEVIR